MENVTGLEARLFTGPSGAEGASSQLPENWEVLVGEIMKALMPFPDAREAVATALAQGQEGQLCPTCGRDLGPVD